MIDTYYAILISETSVLLFNALPAALMAWTLASVLLPGLTAARDPGHRTTPRSPWFFFRRATRRRWRWLTIGWCIATLLYIGFRGWLTTRGLPFPVAPSQLSKLGLLHAVDFAGPALLTLGFAFLWAPQCWSPVSLAVLVGLATLALSIGLETAAAFLLPEAWVKVEISLAENRGHIVYPFVSIYALGPSLAVAAGAWWRVRRLGDAWFRLDEIDA